MIYWRSEQVDAKVTLFVSLVRMLPYSLTFDRWTKGKVGKDEMIFDDNQQGKVLFYFIYKIFRLIFL